MTQKIFKGLRFHFSLFTSYFLLLTSAWAFSFGIDPSHLTFESSPSETVLQTLYVVNSSASTVKLMLSVEEWTLQADGAKQFGAVGSSPSGCGAWIEIEPKTLQLTQGEKKPVTVTLKTPDTSVGGHQAVVFAQNVPETPADQEGRVQLLGKVGALIYQETLGSTRHDIKVSSAGLVAEFRNQALTLNLENTGNAYTLATIRALLLRQSDGALQGELELEPFKSLPGQQKTVLVAFKTPLPPGQYILLVTVEPEKGEPVVIEENFTL